MIDGRTSSWKCIIHRSGHSGRDGTLGLRGQIYPANFYPIPPHSLMFIWNILLEIEFGGERREYESDSERGVQERMFINMSHWDPSDDLVAFLFYSHLFVSMNCIYLFTRARSGGKKVIRSVRGLTSLQFFRTQGVINNFKKLLVLLHFVQMQP